MTRRAAIVAVLCLLPTLARAGLAPGELARVELAPPLHAAIPFDLVLRDLDDHPLTFETAQQHKPAVLLFIDFNCRTICRPALAIASSALNETGLRPNIDFRLLVVGLDTNANAADAKAMTAPLIDKGISPATSVLRGDAAVIDRLSASVGYRYRFDKDADQFAHPAGVIVLRSNGDVSRALSSLALNPDDLRLALLEAGEGRSHGLLQRVALICYGFDPVHGVYSLRVLRLLKLAGLLTVLMLAAGIFFLERRAARLPLRGGSS
jgi:protein SCO1/2